MPLVGTLSGTACTHPGRNLVYCLLSLCFLLRFKLLPLVPLRIRGGEGYLPDLYEICHDVNSRSSTTTARYAPMPMAQATTTAAHT